MTPQLAPVENKTPAPPKALWRPDQSFWQRYSPHHEFPLATVSAISLCGLAVGLLFLFWILALGVDNEADGPVRVGAIEILGQEGGGGGFDGPGNGQSPLGAKGRTEAVEPGSKPRLVRTLPDKAATTLPDEIKANPLSPATPLDFTPVDENPLASLTKDANRAALEDKIAAEKAAALKANPGVGGPPGGKNSPGAGGGTGGGYGTGSGSKSGPGGGSRAGRAPTIQEIHAEPLAIQSFRRGRTCAKAYRHGRIRGAGFSRRQVLSKAGDLRKTPSGSRTCQSSKEQRRGYLD